MLEVCGIKKKFGDKTAVNNLSFSMNPGEVTGLLGPNGAGKTTTIRILLGILAPDEGEVLFNSKLVDNRYRKITGYVPEERGLYKHSTALENLLFFASLKGMNRENSLKQIEQLNQFISLEHILAKRISTLSKGNQQLVQILSGVVHDPEIILFDEPYNGLDPFVQEQFSNLIKHLQQKGKAVLISTHLLQFAEETCQSVLFLNQAKAIYWGGIEALYKQQQNMGYIVRCVVPAEYHNEITSAAKEITFEGSFCTAVFADVDSVREFSSTGKIVSLLSVAPVKTALKDIFMQMINSDRG